MFKGSDLLKEFLRLLSFKGSDPLILFLDIVFDIAWRRYLTKRSCRISEESL